MTSSCFMTSLISKYFVIISKLRLKKNQQYNFILFTTINSKAPQLIKNESTNNYHYLVTWLFCCKYFSKSLTKIWGSQAVSSLEQPQLNLICRAEDSWSDKLWYLGKAVNKIGKKHFYKFQRFKFDNSKKMMSKLLCEMKNCQFSSI